MSLISIRGLGFRFPTRSPHDEHAHALFENLNLEIEKGSFTSIMGASGCGKSTLLRLIAGLLKPVAGEIEIRSSNDPRHLPIGLMFQDARLLPWRKILANVKFGLESLPLSKEERKERAFAMLKLVGLEKLAHRYPHQISGGQRQRVALARALAVNPELLLMDEPFGSLDAITRKELHLELLRIWKETGKTVIFVTHDQAEAEFLSRRLITLSGLPSRIASDTSR
jgi:NitT/TauT family transport system ATP-binding protein